MTSVLHFENISMRFGRVLRHIAVDGVMGMSLKAKSSHSSAPRLGKSTIENWGGTGTPTTGQVFLKKQMANETNAQDVQMVFQDPFASLNPCTESEPTSSDHWSN